MEFIYYIDKENYVLPIFPLSLRRTIRGEEEEDEEEEKDKQINTNKIFKSDECVICLNNPLNILFCNCGHIPICAECDDMKTLNNCPVCKTENTIKRIIE